MRCNRALQQSSVLAVSLLCMPTLKQKLVWKVVFSNFGQNHNVLPGLMCLRRATCPLFALPEMQNLGITLELDLKGAKITCPAFGLCSSPIEYSTINRTHCDGFDESCIPAKVVSRRLARRNMYLLLFRNENQRI